MKLALLGADDESLALIRWALHEGGHELVAAYDVGDHAAEVTASAPHVPISTSWESLVLGASVDAVVVGRGGPLLAEKTGIPDAERRADQLRKLAQAAVPMIVVCPACEAIVGFEIEMIRKDVQGVIVSLVPGATHPSIARLEELITEGESSPLGTAEQVALERDQADRSRDAVLSQLAQDVTLLRRLIGNIRTVNASGPTTAVGRDPLGPKPKELPSLTNLSVHLTGADGRPARWSIAPAVGPTVGSLTIIGQRGKATLHMPQAGNWWLEIVGEQPANESFSHPGDAAEIFSQLTHAGVQVRQDESAWLSACRDQEVAEAVDRSIQRGRTIELFNEDHTEEASFKGIMAMGGCLLLVMAVAIVFLATLGEGLRLPMRNWPLWRQWPYLLLAPIAVFLLLQLLQLAIKRDDGPRRVGAGPGLAK
jgi:hypothetical protein